VEARRKWSSLQYELGRQQVANSTTAFSLREAQKEIRERETENHQLTLANEALKQQGVDHTLQVELKVEHQALKVETENMDARNNELKARVSELEKEVEDSRDRFLAYQRKIKAATEV
jgi:hypothetical protein